MCIAAIVFLLSVKLKLLILHNALCVLKNLNFLSLFIFSCSLIQYSAVLSGCANVSSYFLK